jgi:hypothetical protein
MCNDKVIGKCVSRRNLVWRLPFYGRNIFHTLKFNISGWSCMVLTHLECSVSKNGADGLTDTLDGDRRGRNGTSNGATNTAKWHLFQKRDGLQFDSDPLYWWFSDGRVHGWMRMQEANLYLVGICELVRRWDKYISVLGHCLQN